MNNILKTAIREAITTFVYYVAFAKDIFIFEILAWILLVLGFIGLTIGDIVNEIINSVNWSTYVATLPFTATSIFIMFNYDADVFGYLYILFIMISESMILNYKFKQ